MNLALHFLFLVLLQRSVIWYYFTRENLPDEIESSYNLLKHEMTFSIDPVNNGDKCWNKDAMRLVKQDLQTKIPLLFYYDLTGWIQPFQLKVDGKQCYYNNWL